MNDIERMLISQRFVQPYIGPRLPLKLVYAEYWLTEDKYVSPLLGLALLEQAPQKVRLTSVHRRSLSAHVGREASIIVQKPGVGAPCIPPDYYHFLPGSPILSPFYQQLSQPSPEMLYRSGHFGEV